MKKYGESRESAFQKVKQLIIETAIAGKNLNISAIDSIDLGDAVKWKIAYLYSDNKILNIFSKNKLKKIAIVLGLEVSKKMPFSELQNNILKNKPAGEEFFDYGARIWDLDKENTTKNYWIYSPGEQAYKRDEFFNEGIVALGWDKLNDLTEYDSRNEITDALRSVYGLSLIHIQMCIRDSNKTTSEAKNELINYVENQLGKPISPTAKSEEKFNIFKINLQGGW